MKVGEQVEKQALAKEKEVARKYKTMYEKDKKQLQEQLNNRYQEQVQALKKDMDSRIAEVARLKSVEQIKLKKLAQQKAELEQRLTAETLQA